MQTHRTTLVAASVFTGLALVVLPAVAANAHNYAVSTVPAAGSTLAQLPAEFIITTNEDLLDLGGASKGFAIEIMDAAGKFYGNGCVSVHGASMATAAAVGTPGPYTVIWQGVSIDGHIASAKITFTWQPSAQTTPSVGSATPPVCGKVNPEATTASAPATPAASTTATGPAVVDPSVSTGPLDSSAGSASEDAAKKEAARTAASADTLLTLTSIAAAALVIASAIIVSRRRTARKRLLGAPEGHAQR